MKTHYLFLLLFLCACSTSKSVKQVNTEILKQQKVYPKFPGGEDSLYSYLKAAIPYPDTLLQSKKEGIVGACCEIDGQGKIADMEIWGYDSICKQLVENALMKMPQWTPAGENLRNSSARCFFTFDFVIPQLAAQDSTEMDIYELVYPLPEYPGGMSRLEKYVRKSVSYPFPVRLGKKGDAIVLFELNRHGEMTKSVMIKSLSKQCNRKIIKALEMMHKWIPGSARGPNYNTVWEMTLSFGLNRKPTFVKCEVVDIISHWCIPVNPLHVPLDEGKILNYSITIEGKL